MGSPVSCSPTAYRSPRSRVATVGLCLAALWPGPIPCWHRHAELAEPVLARHAHTHHGSHSHRAAASATEWHFHWLAPWELLELEHDEDTNQPANRSHGRGEGAIAVTVPATAGRSLDVAGSARPIWLAVDATDVVMGDGSAKCAVRGRVFLNSAGAIDVDPRLLCAVALC